jgi:hypothetical protein
MSKEKLLALIDEGDQQDIPVLLEEVRREDVPGFLRSRTCVDYDWADPKVVQRNLAAQLEVALPR